MKKVIFFSVILAIFLFSFLSPTSALSLDFSGASTEYNYKCSDNETIFCDYITLEKTDGGTNFTILTPFDKQTILVKDELKGDSSFDYTIPTELDFEVGRGLFKTTSKVSRELIKEGSNKAIIYQTGDSYKFVFFIPDKTKFAKVGKNSIEITETDVFTSTENILNNITFETNYSRLSLLRYDNAYFDFDGVDDYINTTDFITVLGDGDNITISAWALGNNVRSAGRIFSTRRVSGDGILIYQQTAGGYRCFLDAGAGDQTAAFGTPVNGTWHHIACEYILNSTGGEIRGYFNGVNLANATFDEVGVTATDSFFIGNDPDLVDDFNGSIDEVMVWNQSLTGVEIQAVFDLGFNADD